MNRNWLSNERSKAILNNKLPVEPKITLNWIDVNDVAEGCILAATKGRSGERYILANEKCMTITGSIQLANDLFPSLSSRNLFWFLSLSYLHSGRC